MGPVRVKYYGLIGMTRRTYLVLQSIALILCLVLMVVGLLGTLWTGTVLPHWPTTGDEGAVIALWLALSFWGGLLALIAESIETYMVLRRFARAEVEQRAKLAIFDAGGAAPAAPHSTGVRPPPDEHPNTNIQP